MIEVFNAITEIAKDIEKNVFINYDKFTVGNKTEQEIQKDVYDYCSDLIEEECQSVKSIKGVITKDKKQLCAMNNGGKYLISFVSIDNVQLLHANFSLGTIFGIYENEFEASKLKAAVYITYGPTFQLVFASQNEKVKYFSFEDNGFVQKENLLLGEKGKINTTAGGFNQYSQKDKQLAQSFFDEGYRLRFSDSLCLDTHQILFKKGGVYSRPATKAFENGSANVIFEAFPISFIIELAQGQAIDGKNRILDIVSPSFEQTTPLFFGSNDEINKIKEFYKN